jgi:hypothetical protein
VCRLRMGGRFRKITGREVGRDSGGEFICRDSGGLKRKCNRESVGRRRDRRRMWANIGVA